jgi:hypothetical protein
MLQEGSLLILNTSDLRQRLVSASPTAFQIMTSQLTEVNRLRLARLDVDQPVTNCMSECGFPVSTGTPLRVLEIIIDNWQGQSLPWEEPKQH